MNREKVLIKNTLIITIGQVCTQLITFFLLPLYTNILSTEEYGIVDLLNTLVGMLLPIVTLQIDQAVFRELIEVRKNEKKKTVIISSAFFSIALQSLFFLLLFLIITPYVKSRFKFFLVVDLIATIFSTLFLQIARGMGENSIYAVGSFFSAVFTIFFNIFFLIVMKLGALGMLLGVILGQLMSILYLFFSLRLNKYINIKEIYINIVKRFCKYSIPLVPNAISWWIFNSSDRVIVSSVLGLSHNGILSVSSKISGAIVMLYNIFNMSWTESVSLHIYDKDIQEYFNKVFNIAVKLFSALVVLMIACMPFVYPVLINIRYRDGYALVPILLIAAMFNVVVGLMSVVYLGNKNTKSIAVTSISAAVINIIVHISLIRYIGLFAAAISTLVSFFIMSLYRWYDINKKYFKIKIEKSYVLKTLIMMSIVLLGYYINNTYFNVTVMVLTLAYSYEINRVYFNQLLKLFNIRNNTRKNR